MADGKRKSQEGDSKRKKRYRSDGTPVWGKRHVEGPGVWVTCVKGKERQAVQEIFEVFESVASEIWPKSEVPKDDLHDSDKEVSVEDKIAKELSSMKRPRIDNPDLVRFVNCQTNTQCVIFISCKPPVDPVELVVRYAKTIENTGVTRTRFVHRLVPVSESAVANIPEIEVLCKKVFDAFFNRHPDTRYTYKIELRVRNHTTIPRQTIIQTIAGCLPEGHSVDLENPQLFVLVEMYKSICGISVVEDYYRWYKFNVMEIANGKAVDTTGRLTAKDEPKIQGTGTVDQESHVE